jgi:hypothetical protein
VPIYIYCGAILSRVRSMEVAFKRIEIGNRELSRRDSTENPKIWIPENNLEQANDSASLGRKGRAAIFVPACASMFIAALCLAPLKLTAQQPATVASSEVLPDAPGLAPTSESDSGEPVAQKGSATISGTVLDPNGGVVDGATVVLRSRNGAEIRTLQSGSNGEFTFSEVPAGSFRLTVSAEGMGRYVSSDIPLHAGDMRILSQVVLPMAATSSSVTVSGDREQLAQQQVAIAVEQRVLGVFPNFYSTYDWSAPPMGAKQKFHLAFRAIIDPMSFAGAAGVAGAEQFYNVFPEYGSGLTGYSKRFGAAYANQVSGRMLGSAVFPALFHQDPRYFYMGSGTVRHRALYAISAAVIARGDNGRWQPNYAHVMGNFSAGALSNLYYPAGNRGLTLTLMNGLIETAGSAGTNLVREFFLRGVTSKVPNYANGKP